MSSATPARRRPRLTLRVLMLLVLVTGAGLGWWARAARREQDRRRVETAIRSAGSYVELDGEQIRRIPWNGNSIDPTSRPPIALTDEQVRALGGCPELRDLTMASAVVTDEALAAIARSSKLEALYCFRPDVSDAGLAPIAGLGSLRAPHLMQALRLTDAALEPIARLGRLRELTISGANLRGPGIAPLAGMASLEKLSLPDSGLAHLAPLTAVSDLGIGSPRCTAAALDHLAGMGRLDVLVVNGEADPDAWLDRIAARRPGRLTILVLDGAAGVGDEAVARLRRAHPDLEVHINGRKR